MKTMMSVHLWLYTEPHSADAARHRWTRPALNPARQAGTRLICPRVMEGWVDLNGRLHTEIRGVREGLFLFPFPPIPMIKTYSHSHFPDTTISDSHSHYRHEIFRNIESQKMYNKTHSKHQNIHYQVTSPLCHILISDNYLILTHFSSE